jgi:hypothetical protein
MTPPMTIILPHKRNPGNDLALRICIETLMANTRNEFNLLMSAAYNQALFPAIDRLIRQSQTDCFVFWNSDMFPAPAWDEPMLEQFQYNTIVANIVTEPGAIGIFTDNVEWDFGRKAETFRRDDFETWATSGNAPVPSGEGWYAPYMMSKQRYLDIGGIDLDNNDIRPADGFNTRPLDIDMFNKHKAMGGVVRRAVSYVYHLQHYSEPAEQTKGNR